MSKGSRNTSSEDQKHLTIFQQEQKRIALNRQKQEIANWGVFRYPTLLKPVKSVSKLEEKIGEYFSQFTDENMFETDLLQIGKYAEKLIVKNATLPTVSELANYIGYPSANAIYKELNKPSVSTDARYYMVLEKAVSLIESLYEKRALTLGEKAEDYRAYTEILKRHDQIKERLEEKESVGINNNNGVVNINLFNSYKNEMKNKVHELMENNKAVVIEDAEVTEITEEEDDDQ